MDLNPADPRRIAIRFLNVHVRLNGNVVLDNCNLEISAGERIVVTGQNGAGKTTLLKIILRIIRPVSGSCELHEAYRSRGRIAYLNQESIHTDFPISAAEVTEIGVVARKLSRHERHRTIQAAMELTGCSHLKRRSYSDLSGGEKQKVSLARCIAQDADILLLDEPCASLDAESKSEILTILEDLNERFGTTVVMVSHDEETRSRAGWIRRHLENGRIVDLQEPVA